MQHPDRRSWRERLTFQDPVVKYVTNSMTDISKSVLLQATFGYHVDGILMHFWKLSGEELCSFRVLATDLASDTLVRIRDMSGSVDVVMPRGQLLSQVISQHPLTTLETLM